MDNILDLYSKHKKLFEQKEKLNKELQGYVGKNDEESLARANDIAGELNKINSSLSEINSEDFSVVDRYYKSLEAFQKVSSALKEIEKASKKLGGNERTKVLSAEGREKLINNDFLEEYQSLVEEKKKLRLQNTNDYHELEKISDRILHSESKTEAPSIENTEVKSNDSWLEDLINRPLTMEEDLENEEEKVNRIIESTKLPNMGKKVRITYDGEKHYIPERYLGRFKASVTRINSIRNKLKEKSKPAVAEPSEDLTKVSPPVAPTMEGYNIGPVEALSNSLPELDLGGEKITEPALTEGHVDVLEVGENYRSKPGVLGPINLPPKKLSEPVLYSIEEIPAVSPSLQDISIPHEELENLADPLEVPNNSKSLIDFLELIEKNRIKLHPIKVSFYNPPTISLKKACAAVKSKVSLENFKKLLPSVWNIDKITELGYLKLESKLLSGGIVIKKSAVSFANGAIQRYNSAKNFVMITKKKIIKSAKEKLDEFNKYISEKKNVVAKIQESKKIKQSMEEVYGEKAASHLDYVIVNSAVNFKADVCQKASSVAGKIGSFNKSLIEKIKKPFIKLKESTKDDVKRAELEQEIAKLKKENLEKKDVMKRVRINKDSSGYVAMGSLIFISTVILSGLVFMLVKTILGR